MELCVDFLVLVPGARRRASPREQVKTRGKKSRFENFPR